MGRVKSFGKRKSHFNQHKNVWSTEEKMHSSDENAPCSSSKKKVKYADISSCNMVGNRIIIEVDLLSSLLERFVKCRFCDTTNSIVAEEDISSRQGLASKLVLKCKSCGNTDYSMSSSTTSSTYDVNMRLVYGMRCIGKSKNAADTLCGIMNLPPPPTKFASVYDKLLKSLVKVSDDSMTTAIEETVQLGGSGRDICAAFDGTWQKRGHTSLNGVVVATSLENGKVIDIECMSKYCSVCTKSDSPSPHNCQKNYDGTSGGMESHGVLKIFERSLDSRSVRYTNYLGDGDSKAFDQVCGLQVYGEGVSISKLECIGHVQKRMGSRLLKLKTDNKKKKLSDGKGLSGKNRLTNTEIKRIQNYYGLAIRRNVGNSVSEMSKAVWAIYFHKLSTDTIPQHGLCPTDDDTWCKYNKALLTGESYSHKNSLPEAVMLEIKPVFRSLSCQKLLAKCTHGKTQNPNESFNNCVWERLPKTNFVSLKALEIGARDAVLCFNNGSSSRKLVFEHLGMKPGYNMLRSLRRFDNRRVTEADNAFKKASKEARKEKKKKQRKSEVSAKMDTSEYGSGAH